MRPTVARNCSVLASLVLFIWTGMAGAYQQRSTERSQNVSRRTPVLGTDLSFASTPSPLIEAWQDKKKGDALALALQSAGVSSLRFLFGGLYSPEGPEATARIKAENKATNQYSWFPLQAYVDFIAAHDFTTVVGINVEEGPEVAREAIGRFMNRGLKSRIVAIELSNEPWLNHRPWPPEEFGNRAADVIGALTPLGLRFALPLTVGSDRNTPTKLSDTEWVTRMLRALTARIDLKKRPDILGVLHLYAGGVRSESVDAFNKVVRPLAPQMRYLITEFNIRLGLEGNPHLTNKYALEFARKLADVMSRSEIEAMYTHSVPSHSIVYWSNGRKFATVVGGRDDRLTGDAMSAGWHLTPTGKVYELFSRLAFNGQLVFFHRGDQQVYWVVKVKDGRQIATLINDDGNTARKTINVEGMRLRLSAPPRSIICSGVDGSIIEQITLN